MEQGSPFARGSAEQGRGHFERRGSLLGMFSKLLSLLDAVLVASRVFVSPNQVEKFVESYGEEVTVPPNVPSWLWGGDRAHWHPNIRVRCEGNFQKFPLCCCRC